MLNFESQKPNSMNKYLKQYLTGLYFLTFKEVIRFLKVYNQTIVSPIISSATFLSIMLLSNEKPDFNYILTGSIISSGLQASFSNSSSSIIMSKVLGYISDILMPPLTNLQIIMSYSISSILRANIIVLCMFILVNIWYFFVPYNMFLALISLTLSSLFMSNLGICVGILSNNFESNSAVTNYIINPLSMLSGSFFHIEKLPQIFQKINHFNPFFYSIDSFRYAILGKSTVDFYFSCQVLILFNLIVGLWSSYLIKNGLRK